VFVTELEGGTLTSSAGDLVSLLVRLRVSFGMCGVWNVVVQGWLVVGTLLGPEGTGDCFFSGGLHVCRTARLTLWGVVGAGGGCCGATLRTLRTAQWTRASINL